MQGEPALGGAAIAPARSAAKRRSRVSPGAIAGAIAPAAVPALLILGLSWPMLFTNAEFNEDWLHHLWYIWNQSVAIRENHAPSFFLNYSGSVFYPEYAFYAGTLTALVGGLSLALGDAPVVAYVAAYLLSFGAAYGGWYWLARIAGLGRWWSQLPPVLFVTSAYYITLVYARGDLPEFTAVSTIPLVLASAVAVLRAERLRLGPALALAASSVVFFGSHNLTMLWGSTLAAIVGCAVIACVPQVRRWLTARRVLRLAGLIVPALLVNAWFLLPAVAYQSKTFISFNVPHWEEVLKNHMYMVAAGNILTPLRPSAYRLGGGFVLALPVLAMGWALLCVAIYRRQGLRDAWFRMLLICGVGATLLILLMTNAWLVFSLPRPYELLQYAYRLESYVLLAVTGALLAGLALAGGASPRLRRWRWLLVPIALYSVVGAIAQTAGYPNSGNRDSVIGNHAALNRPVLVDYLDFDLQPKHPIPFNLPKVVFPLGAIRDDRVSKVVHLPPHQRFDSNLAGWPQLVNVSGARIVSIEQEGNDMLEIDAARPGRPEVITVSAARPLPVVLGRWLSAIGCLTLLGTLLTLAIRRRTARDGRRSRAQDRPV